MKPPATAAPPAAPRRRGERGATLLDLLVAAAIIGVALIPLLQLVPGMLASAQVPDTALRLNAAATRKMEELIAVLRANIGGASSGAEACPDLLDCRIEWTVTTEQSSASPGVGRLAAVAVLACQDRDASGACDTADEQVRLDTKVTSRP